MLGAANLATVDSLLMDRTGTGRYWASCVSDEAGRQPRDRKVWLGMEHTLTGTPLDALHLAFLDLTSKIEAKVIDIDDALHELQAHEVVDAAGYTWRIDPMSQSFVRRAPDTGASWRPADPTQFVEQSSPNADENPQRPPQAPPPPHGAYAPPPPGGPAGFGMPTADAPTDRPHAYTPPPPPPVTARPAATRRKGANVAAAAAAVVIIAGAVGFAGHSSDGTQPAPPPPRRPVDNVSPSPAATRDAPKLGQLELKRYQPAKVKAEAAPQQILLTWRLPADAQQDGAGIIIRSTRTNDTLTTLSRQDGRLPQSYVAMPLKSGQQYCFLVGVLLQRASGGVALAQSRAVCAAPR